MILLIDELDQHFLKGYTLFSFFFFTQWMVSTTNSKSVILEYGEEKQETSLNACKWEKQEYVEIHCAGLLLYTPENFHNQKVPNQKKILRVEWLEIINRAGNLAQW